MCTEGGSDFLFAAERMDSQVFQDITYSHCTFSNVSFKDATLKNVKFEDCVFVSCYFRDTTIEGCQFRASKFFDCDLSKVDIRTSDFRFYNAFAGCYIPFREIEHSLPVEGNLCQHLCFGLADEARKLGALKDEGLFRQAGAKAKERHLGAAIRHSSEFYRKKYTGTARFSAFTEYVTSRIRGYLWGYRRSSLVVLRNWAFVTLLVFPIFFFIFRDGLQRSGRPIAIPELWLASVGNMLPGSGISDIKFTSGIALGIAFIEVLVGLLFTGVVAALLFRTIFDRWRQ